MLLKLFATCVSLLCAAIVFDVVRLAFRHRIVGRPTLLVIGGLYAAIVVTGIAHLWFG